MKTAGAAKAQRSAYNLERTRPVTILSEKSPTTAAQEIFQPFDSYSFPIDRQNSKSSTRISEKVKTINPKPAQSMTQMKSPEPRIKKV